MGEIDMVIATCKHRLDQLTKPTFDRATVEELLAEILRLRSEERRNQVAKELAWRDNHIDEQDEEIERLQDTVKSLEHRIEMLLDANTALAKRLDQRMMPNRPIEMTPNRELPLRPTNELMDHLGANGAFRHAVSRMEGQLRTLPGMELTDDGLAVIKGGKR